VIHTLVADVRYGARLLRQAPLFSAVAVLALALGIGANTAIFSTVHALLLRELPYRDPDRLAMVWEDASFASFPKNTPAPGNYFDWKAQNSVFTDMAATRGTVGNLTADGPPEQALGRLVTANFFDVLGVRPVLGRAFIAEEDRTNPNLVLEMKPGVYIPFPQITDTWAQPENLVVRTKGDPAAMAGAVRRAIASVDPEQPVSAVRTMDEILDRDVEDRTQQMTLLGAFAGLALLLASIGLYGVLSYAVTQRSREIGLRMALGATARSVMGMVVGRGLALTGVGLAIGVALALAATRFMKTMLYGVDAFDPATFVAVAALLGAIAALACWLPAQRASRLDPIVVLREE
jgi:hypothetical protein